MTLAQDRQNQVGSLIIDAGATGISVSDLVTALRASGLVSERTTDVSAAGAVRSAVTGVRRALSDDVIVHDRRLGLYRVALDRTDAEDWRQRACLQIVTRVRNLRRYTDAEVRRYGISGVAWEMAQESMARAEADVMRASRLTLSGP